MPTHFWLGNCRVGFAALSPPQRALQLEQRLGVAVRDALAVGGGYRKLL